MSKEVKLNQAAQLELEIREAYGRKMAARNGLLVEAKAEYQAKNAYDEAFNNCMAKLSEEKGTVAEKEAKAKSKCAMKHMELVTARMNLMDTQADYDNCCALVAMYQDIVSMLNGIAGITREGRYK